MDDIALIQRREKKRLQTEKLNEIKNHLPGIVMVMIVAFISYKIGQEYPIVGGAVLAIFLGILIKNFIGLPVEFEKGIEFTLKSLLKFAIVLLGFSFSFSEILKIGASSFIIVTVSVVSGLLLTYWIGKAFGLKGNTSLLIGIGTAICGATAIVTTAPILKAKEDELTYAINTIFAFNIIAIILYPFIGKMLYLPDQFFGIWAGTAIHDTSSVVAASYAYSDEAGTAAIVVKLARTLMLIPLALILAIIISIKNNKNNSNSNNKIKVYKLFPYFILFFVSAAIINTFFSIPNVVTTVTTDVSKFIIIMVMVSVGLKTDIKNIMKVGYRPLLVGLLASLIIGVVSISLIYLLN